MKRPFVEVRPDLDRDGALRDFYVLGTNRADWNKLIEWVTPKLEPDCFFVDGEVYPIPKTFEEIEKIRESASPLLSVPAGKSYLNCHFFHYSEIEMDFWPHEYQSEKAWLELSLFCQNLVDLIGKRGIITDENCQDVVIEEFKPKGSTSRRRQPM